MELRAGLQAPDFLLPDQGGIQHELVDFRGAWVLLYFYPKDDTPGCTTEACTIRDSFASFKNKGIVVLGVSTDSVKSHVKFAKKYKLPFTLLADEKKEVVRLYGVQSEKKMFGKTFLGTHRTSFLINPEGVIKKIYEKVKPEDHAAEVLAYVSAFAGN